MAAAVSVVSKQPGIQVELPVRNGNKGKWDTLGVIWLDSFEGNPFLMRAELPVDWTIKPLPSRDSDKRSFIVLDGDNTPKAEVWMKTAFYDQKAWVDIFSEEESLEMKAKYAPKPWQKQFDSLISAYNLSVETTHGCGAKGQLIIDKAYGDLEAFVKFHPEFVSDLPCKHQCSDDGADGLSGAFLTMANKTNGECFIQ